MGSLKRLLCNVCSNQWHSFIIGRGHAEDGTGGDLWVLLVLRQGRLTQTCCRIVVRFRRTSRECLVVVSSRRIAMERRSGRSAAIGYFGERSPTVAFLRPSPARTSHLDVCSLSEPPRCVYRHFSDAIVFSSGVLRAVTLSPDVPTMLRVRLANRFRDGTSLVRGSKARVINIPHVWNGSTRWVITNESLDWENSCLALNSTAHSD